MNYQTIRNIINGYEGQLANAEIAKDNKKIEWIKEQINEGHKVLANMVTYN